MMSTHVVAHSEPAEELVFALQIGRELALIVHRVEEVADSGEHSASTIKINESQ